MGRGRLMGTAALLITVAIKRKWCFLKSLPNGAPFVGQQTDNFNYYETYTAFINNSGMFLLMVIISFYKFVYV